jgi:hypothetical protein
VDRFRYSAVALLVAIALAASAAGAATVPPDASANPRLDAGGGTMLVAPMLWVLGALGLPVQIPAPLPNSRPLAREQGVQRLEYPLHDEGLGVYLEVRGRVEFEDAEIRFADGTCRTIALGHAARGHGLYELVDFGGTTAVEAVALSARARSGEAQVGVRLGR